MFVDLFMFCDLGKIELPCSRECLFVSLAEPDPVFLHTASHAAPLKRLTNKQFPRFLHFMKMGLERTQKTHTDRMGIV